jgi:AAA15 family ATPase/GTPase
MKSLSSKLWVVLGVIGLFIIGYLAKEYVELRTKNEELKTQNEERKRKLSEFKSKEEKESRQVARKAIEALKKLKSLFQAGISYKDYTPALGETLY